ncbi:MAG: PEP-CTERM sorting domain-containing protein [Planctomycetaceae bacterium]|jgi:hypothetical protein|nr:PEP-CTERM sorting domain-containing protein [Planctomycetaceae bacterium]
MKTVNFKSLCLSCIIALGIATSAEFARADTLSISFNTGEAFSSEWKVVTPDLVTSVQDQIVTLGSSKLNSLASPNFGGLGQFTTLVGSNVDVLTYDTNNILNYKYDAVDNLDGTRTSSIAPSAPESGSTIPSSAISELAFMTSFATPSDLEAYSSIKGTFAVIGELAGIYLNGTLLDELTSSLVDRDTSTIAGLFDFEINLNDYTNLLNNEGDNNNFAFVVSATDSVPLEVGGAVYATVYTPIVFALSGIVEYEYDNGGGSTPEPATLLIVGAGIAGLVIRRKLACKN